MTSRVSVILLLAITMTGSSCKKVYDYINNNPTATCDACKVIQLKAYLGGSPFVYTVNYDKKGNMKSIILTDPDEPVNANLDSYFRYDNKNRLTDYIGAFHGSATAKIWKTYHYYPNKIVDTFYLEGGVVADPGPPVGTGFFVKEELKTDSKGRVISSTAVDINPNTPTNYVYDAKGNLINNPLSGYDNKINPYRTNSVFQLIKLDYSANNAIGDLADEHSQYPQILSYNTYGLPTKYRRIGSFYDNRALFGLSFYDSLEVKYDCDLSVVKIK